MDLRFYHDGLGQDTYEKQYQGGLEITYEDYEPGFGTPLGVARTSECMLWVLPATPPRARLAELAQALRQPAVMVPTPQTTVDAGVFGHALTLPSQTPPQHAALEQQLDWMFDFYRGQQDQHRWYGFWNFGDVMHTYDFDRHEWRYDIGGYAWDNSELATDVWLWMYFLRSGRADAFRFAEAMTRHTGEVDVHHLGRFAPLGSRHNVQHWGCSAKQLRISTALNRRFYYYLTADERVGDLMREQLEAARTLRTIPPGRKLADASQTAVDPKGDFAHLGFGTDWGSLASAWLTEWERTRDPKMRDRLLASMRTIGAQPRGFFSGGARMNLRTGAFDIAGDDTRQCVAPVRGVWPCRRPAPSSSSCCPCRNSSARGCSTASSTTRRRKNRRQRWVKNFADSTCSRATRASRRLRPGGARIRNSRHAPGANSPMAARATGRTRSSLRSASRRRRC